MDRLGWASGLSIVAYGVRVGIRVNKEELLPGLLPLLPPQWKPSGSLCVSRLYSLWFPPKSSPSGIKRFCLLYANGALLARTADAEELRDQFRSHLQLHVAQKSRRKLFVHAGAVAWKGRAILIPGRSYSGKSTLVAALLRAGASYYSDEYALFDEDGRVHPYPVPLSLRDSSDQGTVRRVSPEELGQHAKKPLPVRLVVVSDYRPGRRWRPRRITTGQGLLALLVNTVPARDDPNWVASVLRRAVSRAIILKGTRGEADEIAGRLLRMSEMGGTEK